MRVRGTREAGKGSEEEDTMKRRRTGGLHIARMRVQSHVWRLCAWLSPSLSFALCPSPSRCVCGPAVRSCAKRRRCSGSIRIPRKTTAVSLPPSIPVVVDFVGAHGKKNPHMHTGVYAVITSVKHTRKYRRCATRTCYAHTPRGASPTLTRRARTRSRAHTCVRSHTSKRHGRVYGAHTHVHTGTHDAHSE